MARGFAALGEVPVDVLQTLFAALDPLLALRKFTRFAALAEGSAEARDFVALEDWLNDGVPLALPVARECLGGWYGDERAGPRAAGGSPAGRSLPRAVDDAGPGRRAGAGPHRAAGAAGGAGRGAAAAPSGSTPPLGHIGMIVAREAPTTVWQPLAHWLWARSSVGRPASVGLANRPA